MDINKFMLRFVLISPLSASVRDAAIRKYTVIVAFGLQKVGSAAWRMAGIGKYKFIVK